LRQVLLNLVGNAIKFTQRGEVRVRVSSPGATRDAAEDESRVAPGLRIEVSDTGVGIDSRELAQLGEAFTQAQAGRQAGEGAGLGLAISRGFVRLMGGQLRLTSQLGH